MRQLILLAVLITLATGCDDLIKPKEICVQSSTQNMGCNDPRLEKEKQSYTRPIKTGDICTNSDDYFESEKEIIAVIKELKKVKADLKKCQMRR
jgi:hypothetical protein